MEPWHAARAFLTHWLHSENIHSVHSPGIFSFCQDVLFSNEPYHEDAIQIEAIRMNCKNDPLVVSGIDYGTGAAGRLKSVSISSIVKREIAPAKYARLYSRIIKWIGAKEILEIGTSIGITALYLSSNPEHTITSLEGNESIASKAIDNFKQANRKNIRLVIGEASKSLSEYLASGLRPDFVLIDASHRYTSTIDFFNQIVGKMTESGVVVIDDIHHSSEMTDAWRAIVNHKQSITCIDLFRCGIVLFDKRLEKRLWRFRV